MRKMPKHGTQKKKKKKNNQPSKKRNSTDERRSKKKREGKIANICSRVVAVLLVRAQFIISLIVFSISLLPFSPFACCWAHPCSVCSSPFHIAISFHFSQHQMAHRNFPHYISMNGSSSSSRRSCRTSLQRASHLHRTGGCCQTCSCASVHISPLRCGSSVYCRTL